MELRIDIQDGFLEMILQEWFHVLDCVALGVQFLFSFMRFVVDDNANCLFYFWVHMYRAVEETLEYAVYHRLLKKLIWVHMYRKLSKKH